MSNLLLEIKFKAKLFKTKVIIWDVDGTLWRNRILGEVLKREFIRIIALKRNVPLAAAAALLRKNEKGVSWSHAASELTNIPETKIIKLVEKRVNKALFLHRDEELLSFFNKLKKYRHFILTNATSKNTYKVLKKLGFPIKKWPYEKQLEFAPFEKIFTLDRIKKNKPHPDGFLKILEITHLPPSQHLVIGDSYYTDIRPAQMLNLKSWWIRKKLW